MKRKQIKIDWEGLDDAFARPHDDLRSYLDIVTGHVELEGEGEEAFDRAGSVPEVRAADPTRLTIVPADDARKLEWMKVFVRLDADLDTEVLTELSDAVSSPRPAEAIGEILRRNPDERAAWFLFRADRRHELIDEWLEANGVESSEPPPWKS